METSYYKKFKETINNLDNVKSIQDIENRIKKVELEIYNSNLTGQQKEQLLVAYAIGRHSLIYWSNRFKSESQIRTTRLRSGEKETNAGNWVKDVFLPNAAEIIPDDFEGGLVGGGSGVTAGALGGSVIPGAGTVTGAITIGVTGAASGAIGASAWSGIKKIFW